MVKNNTITSFERLETVFKGYKADRTPTLGGWIACVDNICKLAKVSFDEYWTNPVTASIEAYKCLGVDGLIDILVPANRDGYNSRNKNTYAKANIGMDIEDLVTEIEGMPEADELYSTFDFDKEFNMFKSNLISMQEKCGEIVFMPAVWGSGAYITWYEQYGYENFFLLIGLYPEHAKKLIEIGGANGYNKSRLVARAVKEGIYPHATLFGEDICSQRGPMVSPDFLEKYYAPQLKHGLEPLIEVGCRPVWHSDGDIRPIVDMSIDCGVQGFQGFQRECGVKIEDMVQKRTKEGKPLLFLGTVSTTTELPILTPGQIKERVRYNIELCRGNADLVLFTSSSMNPDVPLENIVAMYETVKE